MLSLIKADGFRSLDDFEMEIRPGLNVLVGPNGGGKTNILALLSFVSELSATNIGDAINASGGASKVFRKTEEAVFAQQITIYVQGELQVDRTLFLPKQYSNFVMTLACNF